MTAQGQTKWSARYALSDSVFLTHADPVQAVKGAAQLFKTIFDVNASDGPDVLIRGGMSYGDVYHIPSVLNPGGSISNLVGPAVTKAAKLEQIAAKGPRLFIDNNLATLVKSRDADLAAWLLRPTTEPKTWEILWLLPEDPKSFTWWTETWLPNYVLKRLERDGTHPEYGEHYRELAILTAHTAQRAASYAANNKLQLMTGGDPKQLFPANQLDAVIARTPGLPRDFIAYITGVLATI